MKTSITPKNSLRSLNLNSAEFNKLCMNSTKENTENKFKSLFDEAIGDRQWDQEGNLDKEIMFLYSISSQRIQVLLNGILECKDPSILTFHIEDAKNGYYDNIIFEEVQEQLIKKGYIAYYKDWDEGIDGSLNTGVRKLSFLYKEIPNCIKRYKIPVQQWLMNNSTRGWYVLGEKFEFQDFEKFFLEFNSRFL